MLGYGCSGRCGYAGSMELGFQFFFVTKVVGYIISKYRGLCGGVVCVLFVWMVVGVCYVVGGVCLGTWSLFEGRVMWSMYVVCMMFVVICVCCWSGCLDDVSRHACGEMVVVYMLVYGTVVCEVRGCSMCCGAAAGGGVFVPRA